MDNPFKVGDKIIVLRYHITRSDLYDEIGEVVKVNFYNVFVKLPNHKAPGMAPDFEWGFNIGKNLPERLAFYTPTTTVGIAVRQEKPCKVCRRPNDLGVRSCWHCGNAPV